MLAPGKRTAEDKSISETRTSSWVAAQQSCWSYSNWRNERVATAFLYKLHAALWLYGPWWQIQWHPILAFCMAYVGPGKGEGRWYHRIIWLPLLPSEKTWILPYIEGNHCTRSTKNPSASWVCLLLKIHVHVHKMSFCRLSPAFLHYISYGSVVLPITVVSGHLLCKWVD